MMFLTQQAHRAVYTKVTSGFGNIFICLFLTFI